MRKKIGILDVLIVFVVILVLAFGYLYFNKNSDQNTEDFSIVVEGTYVDKEIADKISVGDEVYEAKRNEYVGIIKNVEVLEMEEKNEDKTEGKFVISKVPDKYKVLVTVDAKGSINNQVAVVGFTDVYVGQQLILVNKDFVLNGTTLKVDAKEEK